VCVRETRGRDVQCKGEGIEEVVNECFAGREVGFHESAEAREDGVGRPDVGLRGVEGITAIEGFFVIRGWCSGVLRGGELGRGIAGRSGYLLEAWGGVAAVVRATWGVRGEELG
jgi:hypothetical protein